MHDRNLRSEEQLASNARRFAEYKRTIDNLTENRRELTVALEKERRHNREEMERTAEDYAMIRSDRDRYKAQTEMQEIEMKRLGRTLPTIPQGWKGLRRRIKRFLKWLRHLPPLLQSGR